MDLLRVCARHRTSQLRLESLPHRSNCRHWSALNRHRLSGWYASSSLLGQKSRDKCAHLPDSRYLSGSCEATIRKIREQTSHCHNDDGCPMKTKHVSNRSLGLGNPSNGDHQHISGKPFRAFGECEDCSGHFDHTKCRGRPKQPLRDDK